MNLQYEFIITKKAVNADCGSAAAKNRLEAYAKMLQEKKEQKVREDNAEQD